MSTIGEKLSLIRNKFRLSSSAMARKLGCSSNYYIDLEKGLATLNKDVEKSLIEKLHVSKDFLYGDSEMFDGSENVGERLKEIRKKLNLSAEQMSKKLGCSSKYYINLEKGLATLNRDVEKSLFENLKVDKSFLYGVSEENELIEGAEKVGVRLREIRTERGLTQVQLAGLVRIPQDVISCLESGARKMTERIATRLADVLDVSPRWLLYGIKEEKYYPVDQKMINFLNKNEEIRKQIRKLMNKEK